MFSFSKFLNSKEAAAYYYQRKAEEEAVAKRKREFEKAVVEAEKERLREDLEQRLVTTVNAATGYRMDVNATSYVEFTCEKKNEKHPCKEVMDALRPLFDQLHEEGYAASFKRTTREWAMVGSDGQKPSDMFIEVSNPNIR